MENIFYILRSDSPDRIAYVKDAFKSLSSHSQSIDILITQAYRIDENGLVWGYLDQNVISYAKQHAIKLMPFFINGVDFDKDKAHQFLSNPNAQKNALLTIVDICKKNDFYGVQFDFEMISIEDRDKLTEFYRSAADLLHKNGYIVSFAIAPVLTSGPFPSDFQKKIYTSWEGAYDFKALGQFSDFVTIMAYNQHGGTTTPGPTASLPWVEEIIHYGLKYIPAEKISLGVPVYSNYWVTSPNAANANKIEGHSTDLSYTQLIYIAQKYKARLTWDKDNKFYYALFQHDSLNEYLFAEEVKSFEAKIDLVKKYHLRGISVFDIGREDPAIWDVIKK